MILASGDLSLERPGLAIVSIEPADASIADVPHRHGWVLVNSDPDLVAAELEIEWDSTASRILAINRCAICGELHRGSVRECRMVNCRAHSICAGRAHSRDAVPRTMDVHE